MNSYVPRPAKPLAGPQGNPVGQPYGSDALHRLSLGKSTGADTSTDALGRAMFRANQNRKNFGVVRPTKKDTTPSTRTLQLFTEVINQGGSTMKAAAIALLKKVVNVVIKPFGSTWN